MKRCARPPASLAHQLHDARTPAYPRAGAAHSRCHIRESPAPRSSTNFTLTVGGRVRTYPCSSGASSPNASNLSAHMGTSATMVSMGSAESQRWEVASVLRGTVFGRPFGPDQIVDETLAQSLVRRRDATFEARTLCSPSSAPILANAGETELRKHPVAVWLENALLHSRSETGGWPGECPWGSISRRGISRRTQARLEDRCQMFS